MALQAGDELLNGKYRIERRIGKGGFGSVYLAHDTLLGRQVAIKELLTAMVDDPTVVKRFVLEARVAIDLRHPNIVEVYDVFPEGGDYYIAMEYLAGGSLQDRLRAKGQLSVDEALRIMAQVCAGLAHAHRKGVVHCDVKPANILFAGAGTPKVGDFGIAHISSDLMTRVWRTAAQFTAGTMRYMSPEQLEGVRDDPRVDVHALGAVLYEMLAGRPYLEFETESTPAAQMRNMQRIAEEPARPLPSGVPPWLGAVVKKALGKRLESRYADAGELRAALQATEAPTIQVEELPMVHQVVKMPQRGPGAAVASPVARRPRARGTPVWFWPMVGGGGAMLILVVVLVIFAGLGGGPPVPPPPAETPATLPPTALISRTAAITQSPPVPALSLIFCPEPEGWVQYHVRQGDTFANLNEKLCRLGRHCCVGMDRIADVNRISNEDLITGGQRLCLPCDPDALPLTPTPLPTSAATITPDLRDTATHTATLIPTSTSTPRLTASRTPLPPPTATLPPASQLSSTPIPTPQQGTADTGYKYPPPELVSPDSWEKFQDPNDEFIFEWRPVGTLDGNEYYELSRTDGIDFQWGQVHCTIRLTKETSVQKPAGHDSWPSDGGRWSGCNFYFPSVYRWQVRVVEIQNGTVLRALSPPSAREFIWAY